MRHRETATKAGGYERPGGWRGERGEGDTDETRSHLPFTSQRVVLSSSARTSMISGRTKPGWAGSFSRCDQDPLPRLNAESGKTGGIGSEGCDD